MICKDFYFDEYENNYPNYKNNNNKLCDNSENDDDDDNDDNFDNDYKILRTAPFGNIFNNLEKYKRIFLFFLICIPNFISIFVIMIIVKKF